MASPVTALLAWYESLPKPQRQSLALFAAGFNPGLEEVHAAGLNDAIAAFTRVVTRCETDRFRTMGLMVSLRASFEFFFSRDWEAVHRYWEETGRESFARMERKSWSEVDEYAELVRRCVRERESQHAQELATIEKWRQLVATDLSDDSLDAWRLQESECVLTPLGSGEAAR